ncbi:uncharacterized protein Z518_06032 [Rhinocladiella mackenziei CBS 650.93]|uniref:HNH nuclease domain-containing protein n=1 Tax=Rhinocladiella mackenziei CBS 650.93 TaxID=1442369 RepID=A0A0D2J7Y5_9EURO|nr:uncharacterized protein Z518_06032 [Rhinocladiella mackenziei CBS 650.93]KIX05160.1 hypothetical protein Z518_06032 [Rhinocladiella mackenziei CBS 650.93]
MAPISKKKSRKGSPKHLQRHKKTRKRMATAPAPRTDSVDFSNEDYNIRSPERTQLLTKIKEAISGANVSPAFWACCQLADMNCLQKVSKVCEDFPRVILGYDESVALLPLQWSQRFQDSRSQAVSQGPGNGKKRKLNSDRQSWVQRSDQQAHKISCKERDDHKCVLTKQWFPEAAHIFPYCMLNSLPKEDQPQAMRVAPSFWNLLGIFWDEDRVNRWKKTIFPDSQNPNRGVDRCFNLICLNGDVRMKWTKGMFALKPLGLSSDQKQLTVQFFWQVLGNYNIKSRVDLLTEPTSSKGLDGFAGQFLCRSEDDGSTPRLCFGDILTLHTKDPEELPLPSVELLDMQWLLQRLVGMLGVAGWPILDWDDDDGWLIPDHTLNVEKSQ